MTFTALLVPLTLLAANPADLNVLNDDVLNVPPPRMVYASLLSEADEAFRQRREGLAKITNAEEARQYQAELRKLFLEQLGGFPERTPLNARVVGKLEGTDYRVEKIIYESRPQHHVTATLYLPDTPPPYPAVLIACGHTKSGKAAGYNQRMGILLAKNGIAAMCYDPIGQGERSQILTSRNPEDARAAYTSSTTEHFLAGIGAILVGTNTATYRTYDGIRGIDYLVSRDDIDADAIGCTGCSGGGTLTSYIMALDERVACAAPACYITTFERLVHTIGPQDAEQNVFGQIARGIEQTDYVLMRAPRPTLICSTTDDFFDIEGSWDTFRQAKRFYALFDTPEKVDLVEAPGKHGVTELSRETMTHWMRRWMLGQDNPVDESEFETWSEQQLQCTPHGHVLLLKDERSVYDLNLERAADLAERRKQFLRDSNDTQLRATIRKVAAIHDLGEVERVSLGTEQLEGYRVERLVLKPQADIALPCVKFLPNDASSVTGTVLWLHDQGKAAQRNEIESLVRAGNVVLAADLRGLGETSAVKPGSQLGDWKTFYLAYLLGKSMVGLRTVDVQACLAELQRHDTGKPPQVVAYGEAALPALHAAALEPDRVGSLVLVRSIRSWEDVVATTENVNQFPNLVHNVLAYYDLPDLIRLAGSSKVQFVEDIISDTSP